METVVVDLADPVAVELAADTTTCEICGADLRSFLLRYELCPGRCGFARAIRARLHAIRLEREREDLTCRDCR